ncbi:hypothetical protein A2867_02010 [Candidatus Daviesbacteria bacterium RIFCSPHIGHO2_01_FULL_40_11]|uniref:MurNAc-LAA domain-containing protein n=1 Tax=Candidatus Daviesbacteria bacterium RIFCSPHIGHO2_01_FULL_40_11 TaxID=1797762 RepID=A0A1F5JM37_9BACT|nr:MAG: hypothetical protein A2867_02010 [Candidatus Daviesbacteria bacterium RIFCSPHIGHO2_01_FULL_40_11]
MLKRTSIFVLFLFAFVFSLPQTTLAGSPVTDHKIIIDAGHGGDDSGSTACLNLPEKIVNLDISNDLKELLIANGAVNVYMTRTGDETLSNADRYNYANSTDGEVLVSVHLNGSTNTSTDGTQGLYGKMGKDKAFTQVMHNALWEGLKSTPDFTDFGVTNFASGLLLKTTMPATIQETVFISSTQECQQLTDGTGIRQQQIAQSLYNGLIDWFSQPPPPRKGKH